MARLAWRFLNLTKSQPDHFISRLQSLAKEKETVNAIQVVDQKCDISETITFSQLWKLTGTLAAHFLNEGIKQGDRVMIIYPNTTQTEYLIAFLACLRVGIVPVSIYPPNPQKLDQDLIKFEHFVTNSGAVRAITTAEYKRFVQLSSLTKKWAVSAKNWLATDTLINKKIKYNEEDVCFLAQDDDLMFIQYTSGSTGDPKGVPIHYKSFMTSILYGSGAFEKCYSQCPDQRMCIWVPLYHDYGLICRMMCMYSGAQLYTMDPITFLQNPIIWPQAMSKYRINFTIGPNFSYQLACRKMKEKGIKFDLSFVQQADFGAEPVHHTSPMKIHEMWGVPLESITHSYGFAEATIWVTTSASSFDPETQVAVSGDLELSNSLDMHIVIADRETGKLLPDGVTGDIFVKGRGIVKGYWNNPEASKVFDYTLDGLEGKWYLSGDLGYIKDNKLYCNGRSKDVIIVNGKNIYATDLELRLEEAFATIIRPGCSAAFQVGDDEAVITCEFKPGQESLMNSDLLNQVIKDLEQDFGLKMKEIVFCQKGAVPKTTSGKIRRSEAKKLYLEGHFVSLVERDELLEFDTFELLLKHFGVKDESKTLIENGIDSLMLTRLTEEAKSKFGIDIDFEMANQLPCSVLAANSSQQKSIPLPENYPQFGKLKESRMNLMVPIQLISVVIFVAIVSLSSIPAIFTFDYLHSFSWIFQRTPVDISIAIVIWMLTFSTLVILFKWLLVGRYKPQTTSIWSYKFYNWWFMDRLTNIWELTVGSIFLDTPYLNLFYFAMGSDIHISTTRFHTFIREFDLFHAEYQTAISGTIRCAMVSTKGLFLDHIHVKKGTKVKPVTFCYPGDVFNSNQEARQNYEKTEECGRLDIILQVQRYILPFLVLVLSTAGAYIVSISNQHLPEFAGDVALKPLFVIFGIHFILLIVSALCARIDMLSYTADRLGTLGFGWLLTLMTMNTNLINVFHRLLYGTQVDLTAQLNSFNSIAPSQGRFVTVGAYSSISTASIRASKEQPVLIGNYCTVGYCAVVEKGTVMKDQSGVAVLTRVPQNTIITENHSYLPGFMMVSKANQGPKLSISSVLYPLLVKILLVWPYWTGLGYSIAWIMIYISQPLDIIPPIFKPVVMIFISINLFLIGFVLTSLLSIWLFAQKSSKKRVTISGNSIKAALYGIVLAHQALARMFVYPFISGTILCPLIEKAGGAKIQDCSQVLMMGKAFDPNWIQIDTDNTEAFTFVADVDSIFESHRLQFGDLILEKCTIGRNVSLHSGAVAMGLVLDDGVTIAIGSKVVFANKVTSTRSGVFFGNPARECQ